MARSYARSGKRSKKRAFRPSRRGVLQGGAAGAAALGLPRISRARAAQGTVSAELFLMDRLTFGIDEDMHAAYLDKDYVEFLEWQIDYKSIDQLHEDQVQADLLAVEYKKPGWAEDKDYFDGWNPYAMQYVKNKTPFETATTFYSTTFGPSAAALCASDVVLQSAWSKRQLFHVMNDFWMNVFNIYALQKKLYLYWLPMLDTAIRPHALGKFGDMLLAVTKSPAMMIYLDQFDSKKDEPNENFARELLELMTVGEGNFIEDEVVDTAKILTGWTIHSEETVIANWPNPVPYNCLENGQAGLLGPTDLGAFVYDKTEHDFTPKHVKGKDYGQPEQDPNDHCEGRSEGEQLIADLAVHADTADTLVRRMIQWFFYDTNPPEELMIRVTDAYLGSGGDIAVTLRELFDPATTSIYGGPFAKIRRPLNKLLWTMRVMRPDLPPAGTDGPGWLNDLLLAHQIPTNWPSPDGHPGCNDEWTDSVYPRLAMSARLAFDQNTGFTIPEERLELFFDPWPTTEYANVANALFFLGTLPQNEVDEVQNYIKTLEEAGYDVSELRRETVAMITSLPSAQYLH